MISRSITQACDGRWDFEPWIAHLEIEKNARVYDTLRRITSGWKTRV